MVLCDVCDDVTLDALQCLLTVTLYAFQLTEFLILKAGRDLTGGPALCLLRALLCLLSCLLWSYGIIG